MQQNKGYVKKNQENHPKVLKENQRKKVTEKVFKYIKCIQVCM